MNNRGFTLIELLAVIVMLLGVSLIAVFGISASLEKRDVKECEEQQELAVNYAKIYFSLSEEDVDSVKISELKEAGYFKENQKTDRLNDSDEIRISDKQYTYNGKSIGVSCSG